MNVDPTHTIVIAWLSARTLRDRLIANVIQGILVTAAYAQVCDDNKGITVQENS